MSLLDRSFLISILSKYGIDEAFERTEKLLELALLGELLLFLKESMPLMFITIPAEVGKCIFSNSLIGTTT